MKLVDTHCHIYSSDFDSDRAAMITRAENEGITKMLMPAIDSSSHGGMLKLEEEFPGKTISMMGVHPCSVNENYLQEMKIASDHFQKRSFIAVGETGLDFYWDLSFKEQQYEAFEEQIDWALHFSIPVVIHSRNSIDECIEVVSKKQNGRLKGVFHCFSGNEEQAKKIVDLNFYLGIGGVVTFKNSGLDIIMEKISLDNVILETDSPYLAPVPYRGKRNECSYLTFVVDKLSEIKKLPNEIIAEQTTENAIRLFNL